MRFATLLTAGSLLLAACSISRPDSDLGIVDAPRSQFLYYNLKEDYDDSGQLKPGAEMKVRMLESLQSVDRYTCLDPDSAANLKAYVQKVRERFKDCQ